MSDKWPEYLPDTRDHLHAIGVIAVTFNFLEYRLLGLSLLYVGFDEVTTFLFHRLRDNAARIELILKASALRGETIEIKDSVHHFCAGFVRCAENRNILMHSLARTVESKNALVPSVEFLKAAKDKHLKWNRFSLGVPQLRIIADETKAFSDFGRRLFVHVTTTYRREQLTGPYPIGEPEPLPGKPPLPTLLTTQSPVKTTND
jgi:hypothetical protein